MKAELCSLLEALKRESISFLLYLLLPCIYGHHQHLSKFHIYVLICCIGVSLSDLASLCIKVPVSFTSLELTQMHSFLHCVYVPQLPYPSVCRWHLDCSHVLAIVNSAAVNIGVHVSLSILISLVFVPSSGISGQSFLQFFKGISTLFLYFLEDHV